MLQSSGHSDLSRPRAFSSLFCLIPSFLCLLPSPYIACLASQFPPAPPLLQDVQRPVPPCHSIAMLRQAGTVRAAGTPAAAILPYIRTVYISLRDISRSGSSDSTSKCSSCFRHSPTQKAAAFCSISFCCCSLSSSRSSNVSRPYGPESRIPKQHGVAAQRR